MSSNPSFDVLSRISRKLTFLPRGKIGIALNNLIGDIEHHPVKTFRANNGLIYMSDLRSYTENYVPWTGEYEGATLERVLKLVPKDKNVLDIGANVGYWTINLANQLEPGNKVYAFEPIPSNFARIEQLCRLNNLESKTQIYNFGLSNEKGSFGFVNNAGDNARQASTFNARITPDKGGDIEVRKFDDVVASENIKDIGFIKIDVEGFEIRFLQGAEKFFAKHRPIIYGEFEPKDMRINNDDPELLFDFFPEYTFYQETSDRGFVKLTGKTYQRDILLVPNELVGDLESKILAS